MRLKPNAQKWVDALRGTHYKKTTGSLRALEKDGSYSYCCLGVLTELAAREGVTEWCGLSSTTSLSTSPSQPLVDYETLKWLGSDHPKICKMSSVLSLANLNDGGYSFNRIAQVIQENAEEWGLVEYD